MDSVKANKIAAQVHKGAKRLEKNSATNYLRRIARASR